MVLVLKLFLAKAIPFFFTIVTVKYSW